MSKFIIIGNRFSHYLEVEKLLQQHGMRQASPSKREQLSPSEISKLLQKVPYKLAAPTNTEIKRLNSISNKKAKNRHKKNHTSLGLPIMNANSSVTINPVWNGLYLDLALANLDKTLWGWSDPEAIKVLDYWAEVDPEIKFIFVYDHPEEVFHADLKEQNEHSVLNAYLQEWSDFNRELLEVYQRYASRSVLVSGQQVRENVNASLQKVSYAFKAELALDKTTAKEQVQSHLPNKVEQLVIAHVLHQHEDIAQLYQALQENATLPSQDNRLLNAPTQELWQDYFGQQRQFTQQHQELQNSQEQLAQLQAQNTALNVEQANLAQQLEQTQLSFERIVNKTEQELKQSQQTNAQLNQRVNQAEQALQQAQSQEKRLQQEREGLLKDKQSLAQKHTQLSQENQQLNEQKNKAEQEKKALNQQLLALQQKLEELDAQKERLLLEKQQQSSALEQQLYQVQVALEQAHQTQQILQSQIPNKPWGAGIRVKESLQYQIGQALIQHSRSWKGWLTMPFAPKKVAKQYQKEGLDKKYADAPALNEYADAHIAKRYQQHLSYRLGCTYLNYRKNPLKWLVLPFALLKDIQQFREEKRV